MRLALLAVVGLAGLARADSVSLSIAPGTPCVTEPSLRQRLHDAGLALADSGTLDVDVTGNLTEGVRLRARRVRDARLLLRTVPARKACEGVELALVMLIREWAASPALGALSVPAPTVIAPGPQRAATSTAALAPAPVDARRLSRWDAGSPPSPQQLDAGATEADAPTPSPPNAASPLAEALPPDAGVIPPAPPLVTSNEAVAPAQVTAPPDETQASTWDVRFAFGGGVSSLVQTPVGPAGSVTLDVGKGAAGVSLDGALDGHFTLSLPPGSVTLDTQSLTLSARWRFAWARIAFDLGVGVRGFRLVVAPAGFTTNTPTTLLSAGPALTATGWVRLVGPLQLMLRGSTALRLPADQLLIINGPTLTLGVWQVGVVAGLALAWP